MEGFRATLNELNRIGGDLTRCIRRMMRERPLTQNEQELVESMIARGSSQENRARRGFMRAQRLYDMHGKATP